MTEMCAQCGTDVPVSDAEKAFVTVSSPEGIWQFSLHRECLVPLRTSLQSPSPEPTMAFSSPEEGQVAHWALSRSPLVVVAEHTENTSSVQIVGSANMLQSPDAAQELSLALSSAARKARGTPS